MGRRSGVQALAALGPSSSPCSPPTFSHQSWQQGPLCGIICDRGCMCSLRLCPTGTWELPSTLWKVLTRGRWDGRGPQSRDREAQSFKYKRNSREFPTSPVVRTFTAGAQVQSLVRELRSHKPSSEANQSINHSINKRNSLNAVLHRGGGICQE